MQSVPSIINKRLFICLLISYSSWSNDYGNIKRNEKGLKSLSKIPTSTSKTKLQSEKAEPL